MQDFIKICFEAPLEVYEMHRIIKFKTHSILIRGNVTEDLDDSFTSSIDEDMNEIDHNKKGLCLLEPKTEYRV
jgi:hypothetical protein